jgi:hypothetical protein
LVKVFIVQALGDRWRKTTIIILRQIVADALDKKPLI